MAEPVWHDDQHPILGPNSTIRQQRGITGGASVHLLVCHVPIVETKRDPVSLPLGQPPTQEGVVDVQALGPGAIHTSTLSAARILRVEAIWQLQAMGFHQGLVGQDLNR